MSGEVAGGGGGGRRRSSHLAHPRVVIGDDAFGRVAQQHRPAERALPAAALGGERRRHAVRHFLARRRQRRVDAIRRDLAARHVDHPRARARLDEADGGPLAVAPLHVVLRRELRAVAELLRRADRRADGGAVEAAGAREELGDVARLHPQLLGVLDVLVLAAAAHAEERAARLRAHRRRRADHLEQVGVRVALVVAEDARAHRLAGQRERHHHDPAAVVAVGVARVGRELHAADAVAQAAEVVDGDRHLLVVRKRVRPKFGRRAERRLGRVRRRRRKRGAERRGTQDAKRHDQGDG